MKLLLIVFLFSLVACSTNQRKIERDYIELTDEASLDQDINIAQTIYDNAPEQAITTPIDEEGPTIALYDLNQEPTNESISETTDENIELQDNLSTYIVRESDNLGSISKKLFKDKKQWKKFLAWNDIKNPNLIYPGMKLKYVPEKPETNSEEFFYYTVKNGDSLSKISKKFLGSVLKWKDIYEWNKDSINDPNLITKGMIIKYRTTQSQELVLNNQYEKHESVLAQ